MLPCMASNAAAGNPQRDPQPTNSLRLRLPRSLDQRVRALAKAEGVSLNQMLVTLVSGGIATYPKNPTKGVK